MEREKLISSNKKSAAKSRNSKDVHLRERLLTVEH